MSGAPLDEIERALVEHAEVDDALRHVIVALAAEPAIAWAGIFFLDEGELIQGPSAGTPDETRRTVVPISFQGGLVGELRVDGDPDRAVLETVATLIAPQVLIGWDTGGESWEP
ncbi:MAG TPA: hypothetical protein VFU99_01050 [Gaiellaceae bacterium]|nr:hypothetical protein [Gaiellaceae bacterium]